MQPISIVVPTYWTWPHGHPRAKDVQTIYDHPTPLDGSGTLPRLLDSLTTITEPSFSLVILTGVAHPDLAENAASRVDALLAPYRDRLKIVHVHNDDLKRIQARASVLGFGDVPLALAGYGHIRNMQLIIPHLLGSETVVALDDDEVVAPDYLAKATTYIGQPAPDGSGPILGLAGYYLDANGEKYLQFPDDPSETNPFRRKYALMNAGIAQIDQRHGRIVHSEMTFGGNMVFARELWQRISFDPYITRGEDMDYLINARLKGINWWLDKEAVITHLPPDANRRASAGAAPWYSKLKEDVYRFLYERAKLEQADQAPDFVPPSVEELGPYLGGFLGSDDLKMQATLALAAVWQDRDAEEQATNPADVVQPLADRATTQVRRYFHFARRWPDFMAAIGEDAELRASFAGKL